VKNTVQLLIDLTDVPYNCNVKFASFDITNMYSNIPTNELRTTINKLSEINSIEEK